MASIISDSYTASSAGESDCFEFWYYISGGKGSGQLRFIFYDYYVVEYQHDLLFIGDSHGDLGGMWRYGHISIVNANSRFQIKIEGKCILDCHHVILSTMFVQK